MRRVIVCITALVCALALILPASAPASGRAVIRDCTDDGQLSKGYTQKDYRDALAHLPTDVDEYTDCRDVIRRAQLGGAGGSNGPGGSGGTGGGGSGGGGGGLTQANGSAEKTALARAQKGGGAPIHIGGQTVTPGASRFTASDVRNALPAPLLVVLVMLGAGALVAGGATARNRVGRRKG
jgi:hypothetical protein